MDFKAIEKKWQAKWKEDKAFEAHVDFNKPKFFLSFPYPYINAFPHIGHLYTMMRVEAFARYKRLKGFNVLFPQGWHATGSPIVQAAKRVRNKEPKQIKIMKDMGFSDEEIVAFENPQKWIDYFAPESKKDYQRMGLSIDWRREFITTSLNPYYDKFIRWQFRKLKEKGYVVKGKFPVVWDPKENVPVGDHDRVEGEGETTQEFCLFKFKLPDKKLIITATLRPDTVMGITNIYVNPEETYKHIKIKNEEWIVGEKIIEKLRLQDFVIEILGDVDGKSLVGQYVESFSGSKIPVLPASFLKSEYGTGIVHSVPSDSADDLIALRDIQQNTALLKAFNLDIKKIQAIQPVPVFDTPGIGDNPAQFFLDKYEVKNQNERNKLDTIKKELYKLTFNQSTFNEKYKEGFSKNLVGVLVKDGQEIIKRDLLAMGTIELFYELTGKVVARSLSKCVVKIVSNQWFIDYNNPEWKKLAHKCLNKMKLYPEKVRPQFNYVIDWLHEWACTRETGLGTRLPWDEKWLIESLSDSTIYKAYYTIAHKIKEIPIEKIDDDFFEYVFTGKDTTIKVDKTLADELRTSFEYWFPCDFRNSGKDLVQNHLTFYIFNNVALFPEEKWPVGIGVNGWVTVDGQKMSKSLGNMIPLREVADKFGVDASRVTILSGGESMDDPNWDSEFARSTNNRFIQLVQTLTDNKGKGTDKIRSIDKWMKAQLASIIKDTTNFMEETLFRSALQKIMFELPKATKWYLKRTSNNPNKSLFKEIIKAQLIMLEPFAPHTAHEGWETLGLGSLQKDGVWPTYDEKDITPEVIIQEKIIESTLSDARKVLKLAKIEKPSKTTFIVGDEWKNKFFTMVKEKLKKTRDFKIISSEIMATDLKSHGNEIMKLLPKIIQQNAIPQDIIGTDVEIEALESSIKFLEKELGTKIEVKREKEMKNHPKAKQATPGKPAIIVE